MSEEKTLNDTIDGWFRGTIFILGDFAVSILTVLLRPWRGPIQLLRRLYSRAAQQVRPHVFLFLSVCLVFLLPPFFATAMKSWQEAKQRPFDSMAFRTTVDGKDISSPDPIREVFHKTSEMLDEKPIIPAFLGAFVLVTLFHFLVCLTLSGLFPGKTRRRTAASLLFFVAGSQMFLLVALWALHDPFRFTFDYADFGLPGYGGWAGDFFEWHRFPSLLRERFVSYWTFFGEVFFEIWFLLLPLPVTIILARSTHRRERELRTRPRPRWFSMVHSKSPWIIAIALAIISDLYLLGCFRVAAEVVDATTDPDPQSYAIRDLSCSVSSENDKSSINADAIVEVTGKEALYFRPNDFRIFISAKRLSTDPQPRSRITHQVSDRIGQVVGQSQSVKVGIFDQPALLEPKHWALLHISWSLDKKQVDFLEAHPEDRHCTVSDANDEPIGKVGYLANNP